MICLMTVFRHLTSSKGCTPSPDGIVQCTVTQELFHCLQEENIWKKFIPCEFCMYWPWSSGSSLLSLCAKRVCIASILQMQPQTLAFHWLSCSSECCLCRTRNE